jgi:hypothetical protein
MQMQINGCKLINTSLAYPEQYDVFLNNQKIGYLRLRGNQFIAIYPNIDGKTVYSVKVCGEGCLQPHESTKQLTLAINALLNAHKEQDDGN